MSAGLLPLAGAAVGAAMYLFDPDRGRRAWVERTLLSYREAVTKPEPCLQTQVPPLFEQASGELEEWLAR
jgi:hypothetical protein